MPSNFMGLPQIFIRNFCIQLVLKMWRYFTLQIARDAPKVLIKECNFRKLQKKSIIPKKKQHPIEQSSGCVEHESKIQFVNSMLSTKRDYVFESKFWLCYVRCSVS